MWRSCVLIGVSAMPSGTVLLVTLIAGTSLFGIGVLLSMWLDD